MIKVPKASQRGILTFLIQNFPLCTSGLGLPVSKMGMLSQLPYLCVLPLKRLFSHFSLLSSPQEEHLTLCYLWDMVGVLLCLWGPHSWSRSCASLFVALGILWKQPGQDSGARWNRHAAHSPPQWSMGLRVRQPWFKSQLCHSPAFPRH